MNWRSGIHRMLWMACALMPLLVHGQTVSLERSVLASTGNFSTISNGLNISATVGEAVTPTLTDANLVLTQGFQQPEGMMLEELTANIDSVNSLCPDVKNGKIVVLPEGCLRPYVITLANATDTMVVSGVDEDGHTFENLDSGMYTMNVRGANFCSYTATIRVETTNEDCNVKVYSGITPNGDGKNDVWIIDNIEDISNQPNVVRIFNRWGNVVWMIENYDNQFNVWEGQNSSNGRLPDGTYYYVVETPSQKFNGWIQVTR